MKLWLRDERAEREVPIYLAGDGTISDRQLLSALQSLGVSSALVIRRVGRHVVKFQRYGVPVLWTTPNPQLRHRMVKSEP